MKDENQPVEQTNEEQPQQSDINGGVMVFHLTNGSHVLARVLGIDYGEEAGHTYLVSKPVELMVGRSAQGQMGHAFVPWLSVHGLLPPLDTANIDTVDVFAIRHAPEALADDYLEFVGEKVIVTPPQKSLIVPA